MFIIYIYKMQKDNGKVSCNCDKHEEYKKDYKKTDQKCNCDLQSN